MSEICVTRPRTAIPTVSDILGARILPSATMAEAGRGREKAAVYDLTIPRRTVPPGKHRRYFSLPNFHRHSGGSHKSRPDYTPLLSTTHSFYLPPDPPCLRRAERREWQPYSDYWAERHFALSPLWSAQSLRKTTALEDDPSNPRHNTWWNWNKNHSFPGRKAAASNWIPLTPSKSALVAPLRERPLGFPYKAWGLEAETKESQAVRMVAAGLASAPNSSSSGWTWHQSAPIPRPKSHAYETDFPYGFYSPHKFTYRYSHYNI